MIEITPATRADLAAVRSLLQAAGLPTDDVGEALLGHGDIAREDGEPVGCVAIEPLGELALLRSLAVAGTHRNRGLGARLVAAAERRAAAGGAGRVWLLTTTARDFFLARGYAVETRDAAPAALRRTRQFSSLCPASAIVMSKTAPARTFNVLFLCTGNSARSILAEALVNYWGRGSFRGFSAGSHPTGRVNPYALELLQRMSIAAPDARSKNWDEFAAPGAPALDFVITVCDNAAGEVCPIWPGQPLTAHWGVEDPAAVQGTELDKTQAFRQAFNALEHRIKVFTSLPIGSLDRLKLKQQLDAIGRSSPPGATA